MHDKQEIKNRYFSASCALALFVALVFIGGCGQAPPPPASNAETGPVVPVPPPRPLVTQAQFEKLLYDMPYADVVELLGMDPSRQESTYNEGDDYIRPSLISWYIWENPDGSFMRLGFTKKLLTQMQSENLPEGQ